MYDISDIYSSTEQLISLPEMSFGERAFVKCWFTSKAL